MCKKNKKQPIRQINKHNKTNSQEHKQNIIDCIKQNTKRNIQLFNTLQ